MEITTGAMMFYGGIAGAAVCFVSLILTGTIFARQRRRLLEKLQQEWG